MQCDACGTNNKDGRKYCLQCGSPLLIACVHCGFNNDSGDRFCGGCGKILNSGVEKTQSSPSAKPPEIPETLTALNPEVHNEAQRRQLTVMFCDLADSTAMSTRMDPEDLSRINRLYQETCTEVVNVFEGYIARYMGDGILCYFGYPKAHENDAERAIRAALEIQRRIANINESESNSEVIFVRVGIATGPVIVGEVVGGGAAQESTAVGKTPNLAARLQSVAVGGKVVIADETKTLASDLFDYRHIGELDLKGLGDKVIAWEVQSEAISGSRFEAINSSQLTPFVGRRHELVLLEDCLKDAKRSRGQVIMLCGEPGIGKSRLIQMASEFDRSRTRILQCSPHHQNSALHPVIEFLRGRESSYQGSEKHWLAHLLEEHEVQIENAEALLKQLLYSTSASDVFMGSAQLQKQQTLELIARILTATMHDQPWTLVFEDLHWIDPTTQELINNLVFSVSDKPILMLLSFRSEYSQYWTDQAHVHLLSLNRINPEQCHDMIQSLVGSELSEELARKIVDRTDGIPLFVEELTRTILCSRSETGELDDNIDIPVTLADSLNARLDSLGVARRAAQAAAIIGRSFGRGLLGAITRLDEDELNRQLDTLVGSGLVYRLGEGAEASFQFKHALIQDAAYASLLRERRARFHKRAAIYLEELFQQGHQLADLLSHHFIRAGLFEKGLLYAKVAGENALSTSAVLEALDHFRNALEVLPRVRESADPESVDLKPLELEIQLGLAACYRFRDHYDDALANLAYAETLAIDLNDINALSDLCHIRGNIYFQIGNLDGCLNEHGRSLEYAKLTNSLEKEARAIGGLGDAYYVRGDMKTAVGKFSECCNLSLRHGFATQYAANRAMIGWSRIYQLQIIEAREDGLEGIKACQQCGHLRGEMNSNALLGWVYAEMNELKKAREHNEKAVAIARKLGTLNFVAAVHAFGCRGRNLIDDREEIRKILIEAAHTSRDLGHGFHGPAILGALLLVIDDPAERALIVEEAEEVLRKGCVGHNYNWFYHDAMQASLNNREWDNLQRFRISLANYENNSVCELSKFYIERSLVLESIYRDQVTPSTLEHRQALVDIATRHSMFKPLVELQAAKVQACAD